ncbi:hypothetical protein [Enterococcus phage vB_Efs25_KEN11]
MMANILDTLKWLDKGDKVTIEFDKERSKYAKLTLHDSSAKTNIVRNIVFYDLDKGVYAYTGEYTPVWDNLLDDMRKTQGAGPEIKTTKVNQLATYEDALKFIETNGTFYVIGEEVIVKVKDAKELALMLMYFRDAIEELRGEYDPKKHHVDMTIELSKDVLKKMAVPRHELDLSLGGLMRAVSHNVGEDLFETLGFDYMKQAWEVLVNCLSLDTIHEVPFRVLDELEKVTDSMSTTDHIVTLYAGRELKKFYSEEEYFDVITHNLADVIMDWSTIFTTAVLNNTEDDEHLKELQLNFERFKLDVAEVILGNVARHLLYAGVTDSFNEVNHYVVGAGNLIRTEGLIRIEELTGTLDDPKDEDSSETDNKELLDDIFTNTGDDGVEDFTKEVDELAMFENEHAEELLEVNNKLKDNQELLRKTVEAMGMASYSTIDSSFEQEGETDSNHTETCEDTRAFQMLSYAVRSGDKLLERVENHPQTEKGLKMAKDSLKEFDHTVKPELEAYLKAEELVEDVDRHAIVTTIIRIKDTMEADMDGCTDPIEQGLFYAGSLNMLEEMESLLRASNRGYGWDVTAIYLILSIELAYGTYGLSDLDFTIKNKEETRKEEQDAINGIVNFLANLLNTVLEEESESEETPVVVEEEEEEEDKDDFSLSTEDTAKLLADWSNGLPTYVVTRKYGISMGALYSILYANGADVKSSKVAERVAHVENDKDMLNAVIRDYKNGTRLVDIYTKYKLYKNGLFYLLDKYRVPRRGRTKK